MSEVEYKFYSVEEHLEVLRSRSIEEAVEEYLDDLNLDDGESIPEEVAIYGWNPIIVSEKSSLFNDRIQDIIDDLDENFSGEDGSDYKPSEKVRKLYGDFVRELINEYPVWLHQNNGTPICTVNIEEHEKGFERRKL